MKIKAFLIIVFLGVATSAFSQKSIAIKVGDNLTNVSDIMPDSIKYLLPTFTKGYVLFKNGERSEARFNYNMLTGEVQFLNEKDSVMDIANPDDVHFVSMEGHFFVKYKKNYIDIIDDGDVQLGVHRRLRITSDRKDAGYGGTSSLMKVETVTSLTEAGVDLTTNEELIYTEYNTFYVIKGKSTSVASKKVFLKAFPKHKAEIEKFIKDNKVDFSKEMDLRSLMIYCKSLD